jgi:pyruvate dehydrogenase E2 component (dihydrolipoamide acetyltransferase)
MPNVIKLPDMGTNVAECKVQAWRVKEGDTVKRGQILADIETDKAVAELESTAEGVVLQIVVKAGETAQTGDILAYVGKPGETGAPERMQTRAPAGGPSPQTAGAVAEPLLPPTGPSIRISPLVRNLAIKLGVDLTRVKGTGPGGIITREDVQRAAREPAAPGAAAPAAAEELPRVQAAVARAVQRSWREIPHLSIAASIDMTAAQALRTKNAAGAARLGYDAIFLKAMARAAQAVPLVTSRLEGERVLRSSGIHIAVAVGIGNELYLPVVRDVDQKSLATVNSEVSELAASAKGHTLKADQMAGACMALSNLGMYPVDFFDAIIFPEHSVILTVGAIQDRPVFRHGQVQACPLVTVKVAADHRLINGRTAAEFLSKVKEAIESGSLS